MKKDEGNEGKGEEKGSKKIDIRKVRKKEKS